MARLLDAVSGWTTTHLGAGSRHAIQRFTRPHCQRRTAADQRWNGVRHVNTALVGKARAELQSAQTAASAKHKVATGSLTASSRTTRQRGRAQQPSAAEQTRGAVVVVHRTGARGYKRRQSARREWLPIRRREHLVILTNKFRSYDAPMSSLEVRRLHRTRRMDRGDAEVDSARRGANGHRRTPGGRTTRASRRIHDSADARSISR